MQTDAEVTARAAKRAHEAVDEAAERASGIEQQARAGMRTATEKAEEVRAEAERKAKRATGAVERFIQERPVTSAAMAFAAGVVAMALLRR